MIRVCKEKLSNRKGEFPDMDKATFDQIVTAASADDSGTINKLFNKAVKDLGKIDIENPVSAGTVKTKLLGSGDIDVIIKDGAATVSFDGETGTGTTFGLAFTRALIKVFQAKALDQFLTESFPAKEKARPNGGSSPARSGSHIRGY